MNIKVTLAGHLEGKTSFNVLIKYLKSYATERSWGWLEIAQTSSADLAEHPSFMPAFHAESGGVQIWIEPAARPLVFVFDRNFDILVFFETLDAGSSYHIALVELLKTLVPLFASCTILDEGGYYPNDDVATLENRMQARRGAIASDPLRARRAGARVRSASDPENDIKRALARFHPVPARPSRAAPFGFLNRLFR